MLIAILAIEKQRKLNWKIMKNILFLSNNAKSF